jgi:hypothetical protein
LLGSFGADAVTAWEPSQTTENTDASGAATTP